MYKFEVMFFLIGMFNKALQSPFVVTDTGHNCCKIGNTLFEATSKIESIQKQDGIIHYQLCDKFEKMDICPKDTTACLIKKTGEKIILGRSVTFEQQFHRLAFTGGDGCSMDEDYTLYLSVNLRNTNRLFEDNCTYMSDINLRTLPAKLGKCGYGQILDFSPLSNIVFNVQQTDQNFSVKLFGSNPQCGTDNNACEWKDGKIIPISLSNTTNINYDITENAITFYGNTPGRKRERKQFEVKLTCNWSKNYPKNEDLQYKTVQTQGKYYKFVLETSYGCIVRPLQCSVIPTGGNIMYNVTNMFKIHSRVLSISNGSTYHFDLCGPVKQNDQKGPCKNTFSQVCEVTKSGKEIDWGSIMSKFESTSNGPQAIINFGSICNNSQFRTTVIEFRCNRTEEIQHQGINGCTNKFTWQSPHACKEYKQNACEHKKISFVGYNCTPDNFYDLRGLNFTKIIHDVNNSNIQYIINVCSSVLNDDHPCNRGSSAAIRNLNELDLEERTISLGKHPPHFSNNENKLILKYSTGGWCEDLFKDYTYEIQLECSKIEEEPQLISKNQCSYTFLWRTAHACPKSTPTNCEFESYQFDHRINLENLSVVVNDSDFKAILQVCGNSTLCDRKECETLPVRQQSMNSTSNSTILELSFDVNCSMKIAFNTTSIHLFCDQNERVKYWKIDSCHLVVHFETPVICKLPNTPKPTLTHESEIVNDREQKTGNANSLVNAFVRLVDEIKNEAVASEVETSETNKEPKESVPLSNSKEVVETKESESVVLPLTPPKIERIPESDKHEIPSQKCQFESPYTKQLLDTDSIKSFFKHHCPKAIFNGTFRFIKLSYRSLDRCKVVATRNVSYELYLNCDGFNEPQAKNDECIIRKLDNRLEYCDYFLPVVTKVNIPVAVLGSLAVLLILVGLVVFVAKRLKQRERRPFKSLLNRERRRDSSIELDSKND